MTSHRPPAAVTAWEPSVPGIAEVFHAHFTDHAYPAHVHDTWDLMILDDGAVDFGLDRQQTYGLPPHAYLTGRRIERARRLLLNGQRPAEVATSVGFHDQAHLNRHFVRHVGTTPARYVTGEGPSAPHGGGRRTRLPSCSP
ncbi:helix-turn-helix transcriptional regulator [Streptosporangium sp. NPDC004379]|uniref:helix-turn-helix transcriptional regulator n=1 Tax=Streptosporangium sp. NPDC004379 TaxID=3366189 RepID=UPI0036A4CE24